MAKEFAGFYARAEGGVRQLELGVRSVAGKLSWSGVRVAMPPAVAALVHAYITHAGGGMHEGYRLASLPMHVQSEWDA